MVNFFQIPKIHRGAQWSRATTMKILEIKSNNYGHYYVLYTDCTRIFLMILDLEHQKFSKIKLMATAKKLEIGHFMM